MTDVGEHEIVNPFGNGVDEVYGPLIMCVEDHMRPPTKGVMLSDLVRGKHKYTYEVYGGKNTWLIPYFDWETYRDSPKEMERDKWVEWETCLKKLKEKFGDDATILGLDACGKKEGRYVISFHALVHGVGAYRCGDDMKRAGIVPEGFDMTVYKKEGSRQLLRMVGMSKTGEDRPFRVIAKLKSGWCSVDIWECNIETRKKLMYKALAQCSDNETHIEVPLPKTEPKVELKQTESGEVVLGSNGLPLGEDIKITDVAQVEKLCEIAGWFGQVDRSYDVYRDAMWTLRNIADEYELDVEKMRELAHKVAAVCTKNDPKDVNNLFDTSANRDVNIRRRMIGHLRKEAKEKNPIAYSEWLKRLQEVKKLDAAGGDRKEVSISCLAGTELNDADVAEELIKGGWLKDYIWDYTAGIMYVWNGVHWKPSTKDILISLIQVDLYNALEAYAKSKWTAENTNPCKCVSAMKRLRNSRSTDGIIKSTCGLLMRNRPIDGIEWDNIPFKLAFDNGVLNLTTGIFEAGRKEDHLTMTTGWSLPLDVNMSVDSLRGQEEKRITKLSKLYEKIQPDTGIREILWQIMGSCLVGQILENVIILTGEGRNGKSVSTDLLKCVLGQFAYRGDDATIQRDSNSGTNQAVANMRGKRLTLFSEPHEGCKLKTSVLKDLTGSSETHARALYATNTSIKLTHKLFIECNGGVNYDKVDQAIEKRTVIVPFPSLFTTQQEIDALPPGTEHIYLVNPKYKTIEWQRKHRVAVLLKMMDGLRGMIAASNGQFILSKIPEAMRAVKHEFLENSDEFGSWFFETYQRTDEKDAYIKLSDVHVQFLQSRTYSNFSKQERRSKGSNKFLNEKLLSNPKIKPFYRERYQPRTGGGQVNLRNVLIGFESIPASS